MEITESLELLALPVHHSDCLSSFLMLEKKTKSKHVTFFDILGNLMILPKKSIIGDLAIITSACSSEEKALIALLSISSTRAVNILSP
ncbi:hypothetical protein ALP79_200053 [Pseudomonas savastanoi pv. fraxini]|nr:hypothetical protein ALP79_200053 [Pseudomonas savastanoi pv. fraxini]RMR81132.1 hypothetical protein ALP80_200006 [Pseudomonas savastanoi pv. fraxini]